VQRVCKRLSRVAREDYLSQPWPEGRIVKLVDQSDFRLLVENAPDGIVVSRDGIVLYANRAAASLLGHDDVSELVGKPMTFLDRKSAEVMRQRVQQMAQTGERLVPREYPARRRDGSEMTAEIASAIIDYQGRPAVIAYCRDVTDRTRLRAQLAHSDRLAALGTMAAGVAHEINNPLAFMGLAAESLARRVGPGEGALVKEIRAGVDRIAAIVRDLRSFGRSDEVAAGPMNLATAIDAAERLVQHEVRPRGTLVKELGELPLVLGAPRRIEQVFVNLFLNAAHALGDRLDGRITVRAEVTPERVAVSVEDDGGGIPKEYLDSIFEPFFTTRANAGGTGLGLSICRDIVVRAGGDLVARSTVGQGTTMTVSLLRATGDRVEVRPSKPPSVPPATALAAGPKRVLIVDDETAIVRLLSESLESLATVVGETVPDRALDLILGEPAFDAIVCDVMMPGMTGIDLHERVARDRPDLAARFVFMCGGTYTARARDHLERVPNPRLNKPFRMAQLIDAIERVAGGAALVVTVLAIFTMTACGGAPSGDAASPTAGGTAPGERCLAEADVKRAPKPSEPDRIHVKHMLVRYVGARGAAPSVTRSREQACLRAEEALGKLQGGTSFADVVAAYSDEAGASTRGGDIGNIERSDVAPPFADAAFELKPSEVSQVVETPYGFHVILRVE